MKRFKLAILTIASTIALAACSGSKYPDFGNLKEGEKYQIGILLPVEHGALNNATNGFIDALSTNGFVDKQNIDIIIKNAQGKSDDQKTMAKSLINSCVLTLGLGTGASQDLAAAQKNKGSQNPILFTAVTDPVGEGLVESMENTTGLITGASDNIPSDILNEQLGLIKTFNPDADKIGVFYTVSEPNSEKQAGQVKTWAQNNGLEVFIKTCTDSNDVATSVVSLAATQGLDAIYIPTDNNVASNMNYVKDAVQGKQILVVCGEEGLVKTGGHVSVSLDYFKLGQKTGEQAAKILKGEKKPNELPVYTVTAEDCKAVYSLANLTDAGFTTLPASFANASNLD